MYRWRSATAGKTLSDFIQPWRASAPPSTETAPMTQRIGRTDAEHECVDYKRNYSADEGASSNLSRTPLPVT
jgi:hypothetical protein